MKRILSLATLVCLVAGVLGLAVSSHAQVQIKLLRSFNVSALFDGSAASGGEGVIDVAYDGANAYLTGFRAQTGAGPVGVIRVDNVLDLPSGNLGFGTGVTKIIAVTAAGGSRDTRLVYHDGFLYFGYGLGHNANPDTAIRKYDTNGLLQFMWSGDGLLSLADLGVSRYDTIAIDPGFGGSGASLAVAPLHTGAAQAVRRVSLPAGTVLGTSNTIVPTFLRDIDFAPNGDLYMHRASTDTNDGIFKAVRTGADSYATPVRIVAFDAGNFQQGTVTYVPFSAVYPTLSDFIAYNLRTPTLDPTTHKLYLADPNGNSLGSWDGSGQTEDGVNVNAFGHNLINSTYYITPTGRVLLFVASGQVPASPAGTIDRLDVLEVLPAIEVNGTVALGDFGGDVGTVPVVFEIRNPGETTPIETHVVQPDSTGAYALITSLYGTFDVAAKASHWLRQVIPGVNLTGTPVTLNFSLTNGDIDGDNEVTLFDFGALVAAFGSVPGDSNWNPDADLDGDQEVTLFDFGVLVRNFGAIGDE